MHWPFFPAMCLSCDVEASFLQHLHTAASGGKRGTAVQRFETKERSSVTFEHREYGGAYTKSTGIKAGTLKDASNKLIVCVCVVWGVHVWACTVHIHRGQKTVLNRPEWDLKVLVWPLTCYKGAGTQTLALMIIQQALLTTESSLQFQKKP